MDTQQKQQQQQQQPLPQRQLQPGWEKKITERFRQTLSTKRINALSQATTARRALRSQRSMRFQSSEQQLEAEEHQMFPRYGSGEGHTRPGKHDPTAFPDKFDLGATTGSFSLLRSIPLVPEPPTESSHRRFRSELQMLAETPVRWENPGLLDEVLRVIPLDYITAQADEEEQLLKQQAESIGKKPAWGRQDCIVRALLKWFKKSFFTWVNNPPCARCNSPTIAKNFALPTQDERALSANRVELYQCSNQTCLSYERFPRYSDAFVLLRTRKGRSGEWANCFSLLCRALDVRTRWVWNSEDHVWVEIYSDHRKRWVHVDPREGAFDKPLIYQSWNYRLAYCVAFSREGATDVTSRYCRNPHRHGQPRNRCPESVLLFILDEIRQLRRKDMNKEEKFRLEGEDMREGKELRHYYVSTLIAELCKLMPGGRLLTPDEQKLAEERSRAAVTNSLLTEARNNNNPGRDGSAR